jgi:hypothetical protein
MIDQEAIDYIKELETLKVLHEDIIEEQEETIRSLMGQLALLRQDRRYEVA